MLIIGIVCAVLAAGLHVFIFYLETIAWEGQIARKVFGTVEQARATAFFAYNQGFYNLFLALMTIIGVIVSLIGQVPIGVTLMLAGTGSMAAAASVLCAKSSAHRGAAFKQGLLPLLAVVALLIWILLS